MTPIQLQKFKEQVKDYYVLIDKLTTLNKWDEPEKTLIKVLLQNIAFNTKGCNGYDHDKEVETVCNKIESLRLISTYNKNDWFAKMVFREIDLIYLGVIYQ